VYMCVIPLATTTRQQEPDERNAERGEREKSELNERKRAIGR
jgi:hypothetical protein